MTCPLLEILAVAALPDAFDPVAVIVAFPDIVAVATLVDTLNALAITIALPDINELATLPRVTEAITIALLDIDAVAGLTTTAVATMVAFPDKLLNADSDPFLLPVAETVALPDNVEPDCFLLYAVAVTCAFDDNPELATDNANPTAVITELPDMLADAFLILTADAVITALPSRPANASLVRAGGVAVTWPRPDDIESANFTTGVKTIAVAVSVLLPLIDAKAGETTVDTAVIVPLDERATAATFILYAAAVTCALDDNPAVPVGADVTKP